MSKPQSYHFDLGNSTDGPIGFCARVTADSPEDALAALKDALPENLQLSTSWGDVARGAWRRVHDSVLEPERHYG